MMRGQADIENRLRNLRTDELHAQQRVAKSADDGDLEWLQEIRTKISMLEWVLMMN